MPSFYYDFPVANGGGQGAIVSAVLAGIDNPLAIGAGKGVASSALACIDQPSARGAGAGAEHDRLSHAEVVSAIGAGAGGGQDRLKVRDRIIAAGAGRASASNSSALVDQPIGKGAGSGHASDVMVAIDHPLARGAGKASTQNPTSPIEFVGVAGGGAGVSNDRQKYRDIPAARGGGHAVLTLQRAIVETVEAQGGGQGDADERLVAIEAISAAGAGRGQASEAFKFDVGSLIRNVRANAKRALPECLDFPEALPDAALFKSGLKLPFLVLIFAQPEPSSDWAVNDVAQTIKCECVYVAHTTQNGVTDIAQEIRKRLARLQAALLADYRQTAGTGASTCNNTMLVAAPAQKTNSYQQYLVDNGQKASAMGLIMEFTVIESRLGL